MPPLPLPWRRRRRKRSPPRGLPRRCLHCRCPDQHSYCGSDMVKRHQRDQLSF
ncbi:unnamed protein product [Musa hybrid cultivar]